MPLTRVLRSLTLAATMTGVALMLAGCNGSVSVGSTPTVKQANVEKEVSSEYAKQVGQAPDKVDCDGDLKGKVGTSEACKLTDGSDVYGLTVKVTSVKGTDVNFDIKVDSSPEG